MSVFPYPHRQRKSQRERLSMNSLLDLDILYKYSQIKGQILVANYSNIYVKCLRLVKSGPPLFRASANGQVQRFNRTLMDAVRCFVSKTPGDWDESIPQIASALRSCVNRSTVFKPNMLMLGREITQPVDLVYPLTLERHSDKDLDQYLAELIRNICIAHETARDTLKTTQSIMKRNYDLKILEKAYRVGDIVYVLDTATVKGKCRKLTPPWKGPGLIVKKTIRICLRD